MRLARRLRARSHRRAQPIGVERAGQQVVDRHVVARDLAREAGDEAGEPGARAVGQARGTSIGAFTAPDVMLTMRPNLRAIMPSTVALMSSIGVSMLASSARIHASRSQSRKSPGGGPPALLTRMSGCGHAASAAARPSGVVMSHATHATARPARARRSRRRSRAARPRCARRSSRRTRRARAPRRSRGRVPCSRRRRARGARRCRDPSSAYAERRRHAAGRADPHDGADRDQQRGGDREEHLAAHAVVEHQAEPDRADRRAEVEPRVDEAVDAARRAAAASRCAR